MKSKLQLIEAELQELKSNYEVLGRINAGTCTARDSAQQEADTLRKTLLDIVGLLINEVKGIRKHE